MTEAPTPTTPVETIRKALLGYRVMAWTTGIWLIALCYEIVVRYVVKVDNPPTWIGVVHGWVYFVYLICTANLAVKVRWPIGKTIGVLLPAPSRSSASSSSTSRLTTSSSDSASRPPLPIARPKT